MQIASHQPHSALSPDMHVLSDSSPIILASHCSSRPGGRNPLTQVLEIYQSDMKLWYNATNKSCEMYTMEGYNRAPLVLLQRLLREDATEDENIPTYLRIC